VNARQQSTLTANEKKSTDQGKERVSDNGGGPLVVGTCGPHEQIDERLIATANLTALLEQKERQVDDFHNNNEVGRMEKGQNMGYRGQQSQSR